MKSRPRAELCQASKVYEVQFELSLLSSSLEKTSFHNGNVRFPVAEVIFLTKSDITVFLQSPKTWRFLVLVLGCFVVGLWFFVIGFFLSTQQYFSPMCRPGYPHPAQDPFPLPTPFRNMTIFPRENELSHLGQRPLEVAGMKLAENSVLRSGIMFPTYFPWAS